MRIWLVLLIMLAPVLAHAQLLSPGPLSEPHASIDGDNNCGKCHESGKQVVARLCLDCHKDLGSEINAGRGLHGKQYAGKACETCHVEHVGKKAKLVRWPSGAMDKLDHDQTGYKLEDKHATGTCLKCHTKTSPLGRSQFVGTSTACASCHKDPHAGKMGNDCRRCHSTKEWQAFDRNVFDHKLARFPLTGKHTSVQCEKCHTGSPPKWKPLEFATCESCHQDPHKGQFKPKPCTACHDTTSWEGAADAMRTNHPKLSLAAGHAKVDCKTCHDRGNNKPPSKGSTCVSCHAPVHLAKFGNDCKSCHASIRWVGLPESTGRNNHDKTRYPLRGQHASQACADCHKATKPAAQRFKNLAFGTCNACHADKHNGEFTGRGDCAVCHTVQGFRPTLFGPTEHATTKFALEGKHLAAPCSRCHSSHTQFKVAQQACADCHQNPHGTQFATEMQKSGCATCHTPLDWHQAKIDHSTWPLVGAHTRAACTSCHGEQKQGAQPAAYRGIPRDCEGCHDDTHAGQFTQTQPAKSCKTCHSPDTFQIAKTFDHTTTRYPLEGKHKPLACAKCHTPQTLRNGTTAIRWRLGYTKCKDCHANPHTEAP